MRIFSKFFVFCVVAAVVVLLALVPSRPLWAQSPLQWEKIGSLVGSGGVTALEIAPSNPDVMYVAFNTNDMGVWKTTDGGATWTFLLNAEHSVNLAIHPTDSKTVLVGAFHGKVYRTVDGGTTWTTADLLGENVRVGGLTFAPSDPNIAYLAEGPWSSGVYRSTDGGANWIQVNPGGFPSVLTLAVHPTNPSIIYAGTTGGIYWSANGGVSWNLLGLQECEGVSFSFRPGNPVTIYVACTDAGITDALTGIYKSSDGGTTWIAKNNGLLSQDVHDLSVALSDGNTLYAATRQGVFTSADAGETWSAASSGIGYLDLGVIAVHPGNAQTAFVTTAIWRHTLHSGGHDPSSAGILFGEGIYKTTDGGATWQKSDAGIEDTAVVALEVLSDNPAVVYVGTSCSRGVFKTTDGGITWGYSPSGLAHYSMDIKAGLSISNLVYLSGGGWPDQEHKRRHVLG